jgi:ABC-type phosphate/phosphonate transport system ATPase subunit
MKVKPEAATAVIELLMTGGKNPETCWAVNKHQVNKLKNYYARLVIYLNFTMMHGLTNLKFYI